jgi:hypothetical protein
MAAAPSAKSKPGQRLLLPFYCGITEGKDLKNQPYKHTHYVLIAEKVAARLGIKQKSIVKPGSADAIVNGVVFQKNRKKSVGDKNLLKQNDTLHSASIKLLLIVKPLLKIRQGKMSQRLTLLASPPVFHSV